MTLCTYVHGERERREKSGQAKNSTQECYFSRFARAASAGVSYPPNILHPPTSVTNIATCVNKVHLESARLQSPSTEQKLLAVVKSPNCLRRGTSFKL